MNEFEWRRQMRDLRQPLAPRHDLWSAIAGSLEDTGSVHAVSGPMAEVRRRAPRQRWMIAAGVAAAALLAAGLGWHRLQAPTTQLATVTQDTTPPWKPSDPRLAGAAIELDAARMELRQAIQQAPDSAALQRLLARTEQQQRQLRLLSQQAG